MAKHDVIHKLEVNNVSQRRQRRTKPRPWDTEIREDWSSSYRHMLANRQTDRQTQRQTHTDRQTDNTLLPYQGGVIKCHYQC